MGDATPSYPPCPSCGAIGVPILYGYPGSELFEAAERGEVVLGGCVIEPHAPRWSCAACATTWGDVDDD